MTRKENLTYKRPEGQENHLPSGWKFPRMRKEARQFKRSWLGGKEEGALNAQMNFKSSSFLFITPPKTCPYKRLKQDLETPGSWGFELGKQNTKQDILPQDSEGLGFWGRKASKLGSILRLQSSKAAQTHIPWDSETPGFKGKELTHIQDINFRTLELQSSEVNKKQSKDTPWDSRTMKFWGKKTHTQNTQRKRPTLGLRGSEVLR